MNSANSRIEKLARLIADAPRRKTRIVEVSADDAQYLPAAVEILQGERAYHSFMCVSVTGSFREALLEGSVYEFTTPLGKRRSTRINGNRYADSPEGLVALMREITRRHPKTVVLIASREKAEQAPTLVEFMKNERYDARLVIVDSARNE